MKIRIIFVATIFILIIACAPTGHWTRSDFDSSQWEMDRYECGYNAETACHYWDPNQGLVPAVICYTDHIGRCLSARGYYWIKD